MVGVWDNHLLSFPFLFQAILSLLAGVELTTARHEEQASTLSILRADTLLCTSS